MNILTVDSQLTKLHPINWYGARREIKRARDGSNKQETLVGVSGSWILLIKRCSAKLSLQSNAQNYQMIFPKLFESWIICFPIGHVERSKELVKLSNDIPQIIPILNIMHSTQIIPILKIMPVDSQLTKWLEGHVERSKELATEVTSEKLCRRVWFVTSVG